MSPERDGATWSRRGFLGTSILAAAGCVGPPPRRVIAAGQESGPMRPASTKSIEERVEEVVEAHNSIRAEQELSKLEVSKKLTEAAERHAKDMATHDKMSHDGSDKSSPFERIDETGYLWKRAAENVAYGQMDADEVMKAWMESEHHKENILGGFSQIGVAVAESDDRTPYWCVTFGLPKR